MSDDVKQLSDKFKGRLYNFVLRLIRYINRLSHGLVNEVIARQLLRSGTSILANYIEARSASSRKDYINFFTYSLKSANESKVWLALIRDTCVKDKSEVKLLLDELEELSKIFATSIITLKNKK